MPTLNKDHGKKIGSVIITILLISLIWSVLIPPATSVHLTTGYPFSNNEIIFGNTITFEGVNLTIRGIERIPVTWLNFSIYNQSGALVDSVTFDVYGNIDSDPNNVFTVDLVSTIRDSWYDHGYGYGYDEPSGPGYHFGYGYGYGYGDGAQSDITFLYDITYNITRPGTFYAQFFVNSTPEDTSYEAHTFKSEISADFVIQNYSLYEEWNLITLPAKNTITARQLLENITGCEMVSWFDAENQTYRTHVKGSDAYDFPLEDGYGLFVYVTENSSINISGREIVNVSIPLEIDYNMIGWYKSIDTNSTNIRENIVGCRNVSWFDAKIQMFRTDIFDMPVYDFNITRGLGIFVHVNESSVWYGQG